jgi:hypothetical protein
MTPVRPDVPEDCALNAGAQIASSTAAMNCKNTNRFDFIRLPLLNVRKMSVKRIPTEESL